jgi:transcriptional regulator with XRE-family HTH domain
MTISPEQIKAARTLLKWSQSDLAGHIGLSAATVGKFELGRARPPVLNVSTIQRVFEAAGVGFTNGGQPGARMKSAPGKASFAISAQGPPRHSRGQRRAV